MNQVKIIADSTCDLSPQLLSQYNIAIDPLCIIMDGESYYDLEDTTPEDIFRWADANKTTPKTSAVTYDRTRALFEDCKRQGQDIVSMKFHLL